MIISFSFLSLLDQEYESAIRKFNSLDKNNWIHFDVMDGNFVENKTFDFNLVKEINNYNNLFSDVHLMIENPISFIKEYKDAKTDLLTFHYEAVKKEDIKDIILKIKNNNMKVGISINPDTNIEVLNDYLDDLDCILIMSVVPGKGGQKFMDCAIEKIKYLKALQSNYHYLISVDGGINSETARFVKEVGADVVCVGSYLANNLNRETLNKLK